MGREMQSPSDSARLREVARGIREAAIVGAVRGLLSVLFVMFSAAQSRERRWRASHGLFCSAICPRSDADYGTGCQLAAQAEDLFLHREGPMSITLGPRASL